MSNLIKQSKKKLKRNSKINKIMKNIFKIDTIFDWWFQIENLIKDSNQTNNILNNENENLEEYGNISDLIDSFNDEFDEDEERINNEFYLFLELSKQKWILNNEIIKNKIEFKNYLYNLKNKINSELLYNEDLSWYLFYLGLIDLLISGLKLNNKRDKIYKEKKEILKVWLLTDSINKLANYYNKINFDFKNSKELVKNLENIYNDLTEILKNYDYSVVIYILYFIKTNDIERLPFNLINFYSQLVIIANFIQEKFIEFEENLNKKSNLTFYNSLEERIDDLTNLLSNKLLENQSTEKLLIEKSILENLITIYLLNKIK